MKNLYLLPTAEEFLKDNFEGGAIDPQILIEFAQMHIQAALKEASEKATIQTRHTKDGFWMSEYKIIHKRSILNAYPKSNIK